MVADGVRLADHGAVKVRDCIVSGEHHTAATRRKQVSVLPRSLSGALLSPSAPSTLRVIWAMQINLHEPRSKREPDEMGIAARPISP